MLLGTERHIYFSSGPDEVSDIFLKKFEKFSSQFISSTIVHSESSNGVMLGDIEIIHDEKLSQSFYEKIFSNIIVSIPSISIDFYINEAINTSCTIHDIYIEEGVNGLYMTEFFTEPLFFNLTSYQIHSLCPSTLSEINNFWLHDV